MKLTTFEQLIPGTERERELFTLYTNFSLVSLTIQWALGMNNSSGNFLNGTNNRVESINAKLKSVVSRYSSLEEFVEKFFLILRVLRAEDHKASLTALKVLSPNILSL